MDEYKYNSYRSSMDSKNIIAGLLDAMDIVRLADIFKDKRKRAMISAIEESINYMLNWEDEKETDENE